MGATTNTQIKYGWTDGLLSALTDAERTRAKKAVGIIEEFRFHKAAVDAAATDATEVWIARVTKKIQFQDDVKLIPAGALTVNDTNFATVSLEVDDGAGGANTVIASVALKTTAGSGNLVAGTAVALTISATPGNRVVDGSSTPKYLIFKIAKTLTGSLVPACTLFASAELVD